jgi:GTP pyrophosphokinase
LITPQNIISEIKKYSDNVCNDSIEKAYLFALEKHGVQTRESGDPFFLHPLEVAEILISLKMDQDTIIAGLLHDTIEDTNTTAKEISEMFGQTVADIVNGVTKLSKFENTSLAEKQTENFKKLLLSAAADIRVLIIKLADRLHNMRTLKFKKKKLKRQFIAKETLEIYAPLAERIGMVGIKDELQDIAFMELYPDIYKSIKSRLNYLYDASEQIVSEISNELLKLVKSFDISCSISGRLKSPYSIWEKMNVRNISFEQLSDIMAFRIIVDAIPLCYQVLGGIHRNYLVVPGRFRDYISTPKNNSYQSLHTCVIGPLNKRIEVQIRTKEMHLVAEYGIAAHCDYKTNGSVKSMNQNNYQWIKNLVQILENTSTMEEFLANSKTEILSDTVFCITPKGTIVSLPKSATVLDFAYSIHSDVGNHAATIKVNGSPAPLKTVIENGDQVEVIVDSKQIPEPSWENYVLTTKAKTAIRKALNALEKERLEVIGKSNFDEFFKGQGIEITSDDLAALSKTLKFNTPSNMFYSIGTSQITMREILLTFNSLKNANLKLCPEDKCNDKKTQDKNELPIFGIPKNITIATTDCCSPVPGDKIVGLMSEGGKIEIHIEQCPIFKRNENSLGFRTVDLSWSKTAFERDLKYLARVYITAVYESGNLSKIANIIENKQGNIVNLKIGEKFENFIRCQLEIEVTDAAQLTIIIASLRSADFVREATRE